MVTAVRINKKWSLCLSSPPLKKHKCWLCCCSGCQRNQSYTKIHTRTKLGCGAGGQSTVNGLACSPSMQESNPMGPLHWLCRKHNFQRSLTLDWFMAQSQATSHMYVIPSTSMDNPTLPWMTTEKLDSIYHGDSALSKRLTPMRNTKKWSLCPSSPPSQKHKFLKLTEQ